MQYGPQSLAAGGPGGPVGSGRRCSGSAGQRVQPGRPTHQVRYRRRRSSNPQVFRREIMLHGQPVTFCEAGADSGGPVLVLLHGLASSSQTWAPVLPLLGRVAHVIAPDLLGHGQSAKPAAGTTRWAPTPPVCATCSSPSTWTGPRSSDTPSAVAASGAVRLPVPPTHPAPRAGGQRRAGPRVIIGSPHNRR